METELEFTTPNDFEATDSEGRTIRLSDFKGRKNVVLVFNRGFGWPFCRRHMAQLRQDYQEFVRQDSEVIDIGPEKPGAFSSFWRGHKMPFIGIPDPEHKVAKLYGQEVKALKLGRMPALVVIDKNGKIRYRHYGDSMSDIPENEELLTLLDEINRELITSSP